MDQNHANQLSNEQTMLSVKDLQLISNISREILSNLTFDKLISTSIDKIVKKSGLLGGVLFLVENDLVYAKSFTSSPLIVDSFLKLIGGPISSLKIPLDSKNDNLIVKCILEKQNQSSFDLYDYTKGVLSKSITSIAKAVTSTKSGIALPILVRDQTIGAILYVKQEKEAFNKELPVLEHITDLLGIAINNANLYKDIEQRNHELKEALEVVNELRRQEKDMIDVMGHELKTPITAVQAILEVMDKTFQQKGTIEPEKLEKYLKLALESTKKEVALIRTLLSTTRVEYNRFEINKEAVNLIDILELSINSHKEMISRQNLKIKYKRPHGDFTVSTDKSRLNEILDNLLTNAIKYTTQGYIEVTATNRANEVSFSVKDTGIGISSEDMNHLGKKFFRVKTSKYTKNFVRPGGTGLGLYVVFNLVKMLGGTIKVESSIGQGTKFTVTLPR